MLFKLSLSNIRKSLRDYAIYFFTLIIGVSIFYVFGAIGGQAAMLELNDDTREIAELLKNVLSAVSVFVAGVLGLLIVYASRFLMKRRNKEFALYLILGMGKGKISAILLIETLIIGIGSLGVGLVIGIGLSQFMSAVVANLFEADMTAYKFSVSGEAIVKTILYFAVMYLVVMIFNSGAVTRLKLIDLMQSGKRSEQIKLKNPWLCVIIFLIAAAALGYAYYQVGWQYSKLSEDKIVVYIAMGALATFFIFLSVSGMLLRIVMSAKNVYFRSLNSFTFRQISSKVNTMVFSMTVICLMLFVTICTLAAAFSIRNSLNSNLKELCPADYELVFDKYTDEEKNGAEFTDIIEFYENRGYDITEEFESYSHFRTYYDKRFTLAAFLGNQCDKIAEQYRFLFLDKGFELVRLSDYNALMKLYGKDTLTMNDDEYILLSNFKSAKEMYNEVLSKGYRINVCGNDLNSRYNDCQDGFIDISANPTCVGIFVVPDNCVDEKYAVGDYFIGNYATHNGEDKAAVEERLKESLSAAERNAAGKDSNIEFMMIYTKIDISSAAIGLGAIVTFLGLYIGLVFLIACGAMLALKELSESADSIHRYEMLRKIGAEESDIAKSLFRQTGIFFMLPLLLACIHSVFGMRFAVNFLEVFGTERIGESIAATSVILLLIYGGYFLITYYCSKGIIKERK